MDAPGRLTPFVRGKEADRWHVNEPVHNLPATEQSCVRGMAPPGQVRPAVTGTLHRRDPVTFVRQEGVLESESSTI